jgi:NAD+ diphosphatase
MLHEIQPLSIDLQFNNLPVTASGTVLCCHRDTILIALGDRLTFPLKEQFPDRPDSDFLYLFSLGGSAIFLMSDFDLKDIPSGFRMIPVADLRQARPQHLAFAGALGHQLQRWYISRRFCGHCGGKTIQDTRERMLFCPVCEQREYPTIMPAVIVGIIHNDCLLLTKYAGRVNPRWALVAGFTEAGETPEQTVRREVLEETGLRVSRITYYKSQPWPFSGSLLLGYFAQLDGPSDIMLETQELCEAVFVPREQIDVPYEGISLTNEMICRFRDMGPAPLLNSDPLRQEPYSSASIAI